MAQKFNSLDEAAQQLGISKERLNDLREAGKVRGYRDGTSWKFRSDEVERLSAEGIPSLEASPSDIDLGSGLSLGLESGIDKGKSESLSGLGLDLDLPSAGGPTSDLSLDLDEPAIPAELPGDDSDEVLALGDDDELLDLSDSILLSEKNLGAANRPPSTIIGKAELDPDGDLDLTLRESQSTATSDVKLAGAQSDVLMAADDDSLDLEPPSLSDNFQGLAEVDVDLEAESSRILSSGDAGKGKGKGKSKAAPPPPSSELSLAAGSSVASQPTSDVGLGGSHVGAGSGLTGLSALELADDSDDQVLGEGSDITLSSASSGINIISPSDSGLALDEVALSSASMSSPLDLGGSDEMSLEPLELSDDAVEGGEPFQLTPMGDADDEEKDSSQIIALDDISEEESEGVTFQPQESAAPAMGDDFGAPMGLGAGVVPVAAADDLAMSGWVFGFLTCGVLLLLVCGMMMFDLVRNIWSWDGVAPLNSTLIEVVNPLL